MAIEMLSIEWKHEDELPELTGLEYDLIYGQSKVIGGVRMFTFVRTWDHAKDREQIIYLSA